MPDVRVELFEHHLWANEKLLAACAQLDDTALDAPADGAYGTIRGTLVHMFAAETRYVAAIRGEPRPDALNENKPFPGSDTLRAFASRTATDLIALVQSAGPNDRMHGENRGESYDLPLSIPFAQAINHGTEHRTNITTVMAARGLDAPQLDVWQYARELATKRGS